jgi:hypothetical protein
MSTTPPLREQGRAVRYGVPLMSVVNEYRAKGFECLSLAECMSDPVERAEILRFARIWMNLAEPIGDKSPIPICRYRSQ